MMNQNKLIQLLKALLVSVVVFIVPINQASAFPAYGAACSVCHVSTCATGGSCARLSCLGGLGRDPVTHLCITQAPPTCTGNTVLLPGQTTCTACSLPQVPNQGHTACMSCPSGQVPTGDGTACMSCPSGQVPSGSICVTPPSPPVPSVEMEDAGHHEARDVKHRDRRHDTRHDRRHDRHDHSGHDD